MQGVTDRSVFTRVLRRHRPL